MDEISKFKFDLNRCLGTYNYALQYKNTNCSFKMKLLVFEISWKMSFFKYRSKNSRSLLLFFSSFLGVWDQDKIINPQKNIGSLLRDA